MKTMYSARRQCKPGRRLCQNRVSEQLNVISGDARCRSQYSLQVNLHAFKTGFQNNGDSQFNECNGRRLVCKRIHYKSGNFWHLKRREESLGTRDQMKLYAFNRTWFFSGFDLFSSPSHKRGKATFTRSGDPDLNHTGKFRSLSSLN